LKLQIFYDNTPYRFRGWRKFKKLIDEIIKSEKKIIADISFIITSDDNLRIINKEFLKHDYFTDVISFDYSSEKNISGEIYISQDTVKRNSIEYNVRFNNEMLRVMIHGILHLVGYNDETETEKQEMTRLEDKFVQLFFEN
jgi:rRNA maturation RNase YbeY